MGEYDGEEEVADTELESKDKSSVTSLFGSVACFNSSSEDQLGTASSLPLLARCHLPPDHSLHPHTPSTATQGNEALTITSSIDQPFIWATPPFSYPHLTPSTAPSIQTATQDATPRTLGLHNYYFRKLPRAYRSPVTTPTSTASNGNHTDRLIADVDGTASLASHRVPMNTPEQIIKRGGKRSGSSSGRVLSPFRSRGSVGAVVTGTSTTPPAALSTPPQGSRSSSSSPVCKSDSAKPQRSLTVEALPSALSSHTSTPNKSNIKSARYSFQLHRRQESGSEAFRSQGRNRPTTPSSSSLRRRDGPRGEDYKAKRESESKKGEGWDEEGGTSKAMTMLPRWKAAFGRSRGKSIEGQAETPSSPLRKNVFASRSQPDLTRLQKMFREEASAERINMPSVYSPSAYNAAPIAAHLDSPLVMAAKEEQGKINNVPPARVKRIDSSGTGQPRRQTSSYADHPPSSSSQATALTRQPSSEQSYHSHVSEGTPLQPRPKRNKLLLRRPGTTQGPYTAPSTPSVRARPGTSGESSSRAPFHPASDPIPYKRLFPQRPKTSSGAFQFSSSGKTTPERARGGVAGCDSPGMVFEISPKQVQGATDRRMAMSGPSNSPLLQVLRPLKTPLPSPSTSSPLFHTLKEEAPPSNYQSHLLLSPAKILDPPPKRVSSNLKVKELRKTMKALEDAMAISTETPFYDTPASSVSRCTEAASSAGPATPPYPNSYQSRLSSALGRTFLNEEARRPSPDVDEGKVNRERIQEEIAEEAGDQTIVPGLKCEGGDPCQEGRQSMQKSIFEQYCQDHPVDLGMLSAGGQGSKRNSTQSAETRTDSSASFSLDAEFWLVHSAEKRIITARTARSATVSTGGDRNEAACERDEEEAHIDDGPTTRPAPTSGEKRDNILQSNGVSITEDNETHSLRVEVKWVAAKEAVEADGEATSGVVLLSSADIAIIGRAWLHQMKGKGGETASQLSDKDREWIDERQALEQRQEEILRTSSDSSGIYRVHSAPEFVRRGSCKSDASSTRKWQRKALVLTSRIPSDQSALLEEPLRSDGSTRRYLISPQTASSSSRPSSPNTEHGAGKLRHSRSQIGPAPLGELKAVGSIAQGKD